jgi:membrane-associated phospholipid phosphatase
MPLLPVGVLILLAATAGGAAALIARRLLQPWRRVGATAALAVAAGGVLVLGALALLQSRRDIVVRTDERVARWADIQATPLSTRIVTLVTDLGGTSVVVAAGIVLVLVELRRRPNRYLVPFVLVTVLGATLLTVVIKAGVDRARPTLNPATATMGPSFPSGHSSTAAAFYGVAALLLARDRAPRRRVQLAGAAVAITVAVATSRVLLDVHWVSDVVAGIALGWSWCALCTLALRGRLFATRNERARRHP